jgi:hypothetical protein
MQSQICGYTVPSVPQYGYERVYESISSETECSRDSQKRHAVTNGHESRGIRNKEPLSAERQQQFSNLLVCQ